MVPSTGPFNKDGFFNKNTDYLENYLFLLLNLFIILLVMNNPSSQRRRRRQIARKNRGTSLGEQSHTRDLLWDFLRSFPIRSPNLDLVWSTELRFKIWGSVVAEIYNFINITTLNIIRQVFPGIFAIVHESQEIIWKQFQIFLDAYICI